MNAPFFARELRRCSACRRPGCRRDSPRCPGPDPGARQAALPGVVPDAPQPESLPDPSGVIAHLTELAAALDIDIADHERVLEVVAQRIQDAKRRRAEVGAALNGIAVLRGG